MANKVFQSYIIVGNKEQTQSKLKILLDSLEIKVNTSPDIVTTVSENSITIGQIRELKTSIYHKPFALKYKINIIKEAEKLTPEAQNALLKIFEEPPASAIIILETSNLKNLLVTLRSRAVIINTNPQEIPIDQVKTKSLRETLLSIPNTTDPQSWIDKQINSNYQILKKQINNNQAFIQTAKTIEIYKEAKQMLDANVNPKFVLSNAILNTSAINHEP